MESPCNLPGKCYNCGGKMYCESSDKLRRQEDNLYHLFVFCILLVLGGAGLLALLILK